MLERPPGEGPLVVEQEVRGALAAREAGPDRVVFGPVSYGNLKAFDASGKTLPARMRLEGRLLALEIDDAGASYPVSIDPLSSTAGWSYEPDKADSAMANAIRLAGDVNGDGYTDLIAGMYGWDNSATDEGRAVVFHGGSGGLSTAIAWSVESNQTTCYFGLRSDTAGDVNADGFADVLVTAPYYGNGAGREGRAWIFHGSANGLSTTAAWLWEPNQTSAEMGWGAGPAGDVNGDGYSDVVLGLPSYDNGANDEGRVVVFHGGSAGLTTGVSWSVDSDNTNAYMGGSDVNGAGDVNGDGFSDVIVSAQDYSNGEGSEGRVWVFHGSSAGLSTTAAWVTEGNFAGGHYGGYDTSAGDVNGDGYSDVLVTAPQYANGESGEGRAYVYHGSAAGLSTTAAWVVEPDVANVVFGNTAYGPGDVNGDGYSDVAVGSYGWANGEANEGRAWVYHGSSAGLSTTVSWVVESNVTNAYLTVTPAALAGGDLNADGFSDLLLGARILSNGQSSEGRGYVYHGSEGTVAYNTYELPGRRLASTGDPGRADFHPSGSRVVRDSNGFWYCLWSVGNEAAYNDPHRILLSYTTTSTPTAAADWSTITLVDIGGSGVIQASPADDGAGIYGCIAMGTDDVLQLAWTHHAGDNSGWTKCTNLSAITDPGSWATPVLVGNGMGGIVSVCAMALDGDNVAHVLATGDDPWLLYSKYNTATNAFLPQKMLWENYTEGQRGTPKIDIDLDNNVYVIYHSTAAPWNVSLLCSTNAYTTSPASSIWKNLAQTTTDADVVNTPSTTLDAYTAAELCVDYNNICHVVWRVAPGNPNGQCIVARDGRIGQGFSSGPAQVSSPGPWKRPLAMVAIPDGSARLFSIANGGARNDAVYWTQYTGVADPIEMGAWSISPTAFSGLADGCSQAIWAERRMPRNQSDTMWFVANDAKRKISTSWTDRFAAAAKWSPPIQQKRQPHPHLAWVFPNTASDCGTLGLPTVSQTSKSCIYVMDPAAGTTTRTKILAVDRIRGYLARSYYTGRVQNDPMVAAAWGGNVHLYVSQTGGNILKLTDTGSALVPDTAWANNPQSVAGVIGSFSFLTESTGTRYLHVVGNTAGGPPAVYGLYKVKADNGVIVGGFPVGGAWDQYSKSTVEHPMRTLNDQVFIAGNKVGLYRVDADGSGEITATAIVNNVRKLIQVRNNDRLFVSPEDRVVYQLTSGLSTTGWTSGKSANLGATKTSGAYYSASANILYVGAGNQLFRINAADGSILSNWPMPYTGCIPILPVKWKTFVYFGMSTGRLFAVNSTTNVARANWPVALDTTVATPVVRTSAFDAVLGHVYFSTDEGRIYKFSLE